MFCAQINIYKYKWTFVKNPREIKRNFKMKKESFVTHTVILNILLSYYIHSSEFQFLKCNFSTSWITGHWWRKIATQMVQTPASLSGVEMRDQQHSLVSSVYILRDNIFIATSLSFCSKCKVDILSKSWDTLFYAILPFIYGKSHFKIFEFLV